MHFSWAVLQPYLGLSSLSFFFFFFFFLGGGGGGGASNKTKKFKIDRLFLRFQNEGKKSIASSHLNNFCFPLGRKRKSDRKRYHSLGACAFSRQIREMLARDMKWIPTPGRNRFQKPPFPSIHTSTAKRPRFQKSALWRAFVKRSVVTVLTGYVWTVGKPGGKNHLRLQTNTRTCHGVV